MAYGVIQMDRFAAFVLLVIAVIGGIWLVTDSRERIAACEARRCSDGKTARMIRNDCFCVEVPK